jgi:hypothetical protein
LPYSVFYTLKKLFHLLQFVFWEVVMRKSLKVQQGSEAGFDVGTGPHGLSARSRKMSKPDAQHEGKSLSCKPSKRMATSAEVPSSALHGASHAHSLLTWRAGSLPAAPRTETQRDIPQGRAVGAREARLRLKAARFDSSHDELHHLSITDREFQHLHSAVERSRNKMRKAIGKGLCEIGDLLSVRSSQPRPSPSPMQRCRSPDRQVVRGHGKEAGVDDASITWSILNAHTPIKWSVLNARQQPA